MKPMREKELIGRLRCAKVPFAMIVIILLLVWSEKLLTDEDTEHLSAITCWVAFVCQWVMPRQTFSTYI